MNEDVYTVNIVLQVCDLPRNIQIESQVCDLPRNILIESHVCDLPRNIQIESVNIGLINMKYTVKGNKS
jgi:hypothetical protein